MRYLKGYVLAAAVAGLALWAGQAHALTFDNANVTLGLGQTVTVTAQNSAQVYLVGNSNSGAASVQATGSTITLTGNGLGTGSVNLCVVGGTSDCASLNFNVQAGNVLIFNPSNPTVGVGQNLVVGVSGGNGTYTATSSAAGTVTAVVNGSGITLNGVAAGTATVNVCDSSNSCGSFSVTVSTTATNTTTTNSNANPITFSENHPTVAVGSYFNDTLTGGIGLYTITTNSPAGIVQVSAGTGTVMTLYGVAPGNATVTVCGSVSGCGTVQVTVPGTPATTTTNATTTTTTANTGTTTTTGTGTTTTNTTTTTGGSSPATLLAVIQQMQAQLTQILAQVQQMAAALGKLSGALQGSATVTTSVTNPAGTVTFTQLLTIGSSGDEVGALQTYLTAKGFYSGPVNGTFGPLTSAAVKAYQTAHGLEAAGYVGPGTRALLNAGK